MKHIQVFLSFPNVYWRFIKRFQKIARLVTSILQMTQIFITIIVRKSDKANKNNKERNYRLFVKKSRKVVKIFKPQWIKIQKIFSNSCEDWFYSLCLVRSWFFIILCLNVIIKLKLMLLALQLVRCMVCYFLIIIIEQTITICRFQIHHLKMTISIK